MRATVPRAEVRPLGPVPLTEGQAVTVLVAVGLDLIHRHRAGVRVGRLHPADVLVDAAGRPRLAPRAPSPLASDAEDREAWLRLAWALAPPASPLRAAVAAWSRSRGRPLVALMPALLEVAEPEALAATPGTRSVNGRRRGRHAARRRWWGRGRRNPPR